MVSPPCCNTPLRTFSPLAFMRSSTVRSVPSPVAGWLNQPRLSAIRCRFLHPGHCTMTIPCYCLCKQGRRLVMT